MNLSDRWIVAKNQGFGGKKGSFFRKIDKPIRQMLELEKLKAKMVDFDRHQYLHSSLQRVRATARNAR